MFDKFKLRPYAKPPNYHDEPDVQKRLQMMDKHLHDNNEIYKHNQRAITYTNQLMRSIPAILIVVMMVATVVVHWLRHG
jgi:hypothetical protein